MPSSVLTDLCNHHPTLRYGKRLIRDFVRVIADSQATFLPIVRGNHWVLAVFTRQGDCGTVRVYNSLSKHMERWTRAVLLKMLTSSHIKRSNWPIRWAFSFPPCPQQTKGSNDCGVEALANLALLLHAPDGRRWISEDGVITRPPGSVGNRDLRKRLLTLLL